MQKTKPILFFVIAFISLIVSIYFLYPKAHPFYSLKNVISKDSIETIASSIIQDLNIDLKEYNSSIELRSQSQMTRRIQNEFGIEQGNQKIIDGYPAYQWRYRQNSNEENSGSQDEEELINNLLGDIRFDFDQNGYLSALRIEVDDDVKLPILEAEDARELVIRFIKKYTRYQNIILDSIDHGESEKDESLSIQISPTEGANIENSTVIKRSNRIDYRFNFKSYDEITGDEVLLNVTLTGNVISRYDADHQIDDKVKEKQLYPVIIQISLSVVIIIIVLVMAYKKFRAYEIGFKAALVFSTLSALGLLVEIIYETSGSFQTEMIIGWILGPIFIGLGLLVIWAVSEAMGREVWPEKYVELDLITNGHLLHSRIGNMFFYGFGTGMFMLAAWLVFTFIADHATSIAVIREGNDDTLFTGGNDAFYLIGKFTYRSIYKAALLIGFTTSILRRFISSKWLLILTSAFIYSLSLQGSIIPFEVDLVVEMILGIILIYAFIQLNLFTVMVAIFTYAVLTTGVAYFYIESPDFVESFWYFIFITAIPVVWALISVLTKDKLEDIDSITPAFAKNVTERQRLQGEIAAAKSIQSSFLPNSTPEISGLDIAAKCLPALEVGGDYYDFIKHDDKNLSVLIGDVAGKGTKAAFVMSLTKGFFKALARKMSPPAKVLSGMNELFYEEVGRGSFISIIYGQFDLKNKRFTYGRAGHNPILYLKNGAKEAKYLQPAGIAIGMEKGILFSKTIEEEVIEFESGDIFVLYTDGFPEAMNTKNTQFGEEDFARIIESCRDKSANEIMDVFFIDTLKFIGRAKQYDDMTMVIVKVK